MAENDNNENKEIANQDDQDQKPKPRPKVIALVASSDFNAAHFAVSFNNRVFASIIAVDGGMKYLDKMGVVPNLCIGDFDSLGYVPKEDKNASIQLTKDVESNQQKKMRVMQYPVNKDKTDLELAIDEAIAEKPQLLIIYGALGQRLDQTISTIQMLSHVSDTRVGVFCIGVDSSCVAINGPSEFGLGVPNFQEVDKTFSIFSLTDVALIEASRGLKWPYQNTPLTSSMSLGISNEVVDKQVNIKVKQGKVLAVFSTGMLMPPKQNEEQNKN